MLLQEEAESLETEMSAVKKRHQSLKRRMSDAERTKFAKRLSCSMTLTESETFETTSFHVEKSLINSEPIKRFLQYGSGTLNNRERSIVIASVLDEKVSGESQKNIAKLLGTSTRKIQEAITLRRKIMAKKTLPLHPRKGQLSLCSYETLQELDRFAQQRSYIIPGTNRQRFDLIIFLHLNLALTLRRAGHRAWRSVYQRSELDLDRFAKMAKNYPVLNLILHFLNRFLKAQIQQL